VILKLNQCAKSVQITLKQFHQTHISHEIFKTIQTLTDSSNWELEKEIQKLLFTIQKSTNSTG